MNSGYHHDIATFCLNSKQNHVLEGRSLMPLLRGEKPSWRGHVFSEYDYAMQDVRLTLNQPIERCRLFMSQSRQLSKPRAFASASARPLFG